MDNFTEKIQICMYCELSGLCESLLSCFSFEMGEKMIDIRRGS